MMLSILSAQGGCTASRAGMVDVRRAMFLSSMGNDPYFPDGQHLLLTHFSHIGDATIDGVRLRVAYGRTVIPGMPAPRGQAWLLFYRSDCSFLHKYPIDASSPPLYVNGPYAYFFGEQTNGASRGNVLDLGDGVATGVYRPSKDNPQYASERYASQGLSSAALP